MTQENKQILIHETIGNLKPEVGAEKSVTKVVRNGVPFALKVYLKTQYDSLVLVDQVTQTVTEFNLYKIATNYPPLKPFVPKPYDLEYEGGRPVGLLVEWKEGAPLADSPGLKIPKQELLDLKEALLSAPPELWLLDDCIMETNISWDGQQLWFAELQLGMYSSKEQWEKTVQGRIKMVIKDYCD